MKVSRAQAERNRQHVIEVASRLFRERGFDGIGLSDVMKAAGLTHGAFYGQFRSKEDLAVQASGHAVGETTARWSKVAGKAADDPVSAIVAFYLSDRHRDQSGDGCVYAALGSDAARHGPVLRKTFGAGVEAHLGLLDKLISEFPDEATRDRSIALLSTMVGALVLSRAVESEALSQRILEAAAADLTGSPVA